MDEKKQNIRPKDTKMNESNSSINKNEIIKEKNKFNFKVFEKKCESLYKNVKNIFHTNKQNKSKTSINSCTMNSLNSQDTEFSVQTGRIVSYPNMFDNVPKSTSMSHLNASFQQIEPKRETNIQNEMLSKLYATSIPDILLNDNIQSTNRSSFNIGELKDKLLLLTPEGIFPEFF
jgi:hypothetical protein